jgi:hypothetical protein
VGERNLRDPKLHISEMKMAVIKFKEPAAALTRAPVLQHMDGCVGRDSTISSKQVFLIRVNSMIFLGWRTTLQLL